MDLTPWLVDAGPVVIVDTVTASVEPGTVCLFDKSDLLRYAPTARTGPHDPGLKEALLALEFAGRAPRNLTIVGVAPERVGLDLELSPRVREAIPPAVAAVLAFPQRGVATGETPPGPGTA